MQEQVPHQIYAEVGVFHQPVNQWKSTWDVKVNAESIMRILDEIEYYLKGRPEWENKFKNKP